MSWYRDQEPLWFFGGLQEETLRFRLMLRTSHGYFFLKSNILEIKVSMFLFILSAFFSYILRRFLHTQKKSGNYVCIFCITKKMLDHIYMRIYIYIDENFFLYIYVYVQFTLVLCITLPKERSTMVTHAAKEFKALEITAVAPNTSINFGELLSKAQRHHFCRKCYVSVGR